MYKNGYALCELGGVNLFFITQNTSMQDQRISFSFTAIYIYMVSIKTFLYILRFIFIFYQIRCTQQNYCTLKPSVFFSPLQRKILTSSLLYYKTLAIEEFTNYYWYSIIKNRVTGNQKKYSDVVPWQKEKLSLVLI